MFYSQTGELEIYLDQFFPGQGFFLEIGCWDGILFSNSAYLEKVKGWKGLCIDPFPRNFEERTCWLYKGAVVAKVIPSRPFLKVSTDRRHFGDVSYFSGFKDSLLVYSQIIQEYCDYEEVIVPTITLAELYQQFNLPVYIEFLSIDTEGSELEILQSINFHQWHYGMICVEHNNNREVKANISSLLSHYGYITYKDIGWDMIYIHEELL